MHKVFQVISVVLALGGIYMLVFGLKVRTGIADDLRKKFRLEEEGFIALSDVRQHIPLVIWGSVLVTIAGLLQLWMIVLN